MEIGNNHKLLRAHQITNPDGILAVSKSTFWSMVRAGTISQGIKIGPRMRAWRASEITALIDRLEAEGDAHG